MKEWPQSLNTIGKRCFVNCFKIAYQQKGELSHNDIRNHDPELSNNNNQYGLNLRCGAMKEIFSGNKEYDCLKVCKDSRKLEPCISKKAEDLYHTFFRNPSE